ncbi:MAG: hypothetical protein U1F76_11275 [Candidatus Competibacteraceae bacterium]
MPDTLLVPMELDALVVNNQLAARDTFRWWTFNYNALDQYKSPEPLAFNQFVTGQKTGVYLHWTLPRSLRSGRTGPTVGSSSAYPLVPNRWLIVRYSRTSPQPLTGWVLESDCPTSPETNSEYTSAYLVDPSTLALWKASTDKNRNSAYVSRVSVSQANPDPAKPMYANLGISFDMKTWHERAPQTMFLTAVAAGNAEFSIYVAHNLNIFSFYDALPDIHKDTISYFITGWYSHVTKDIVTPGSGNYTGGTTVAEVLNRLEWTIAGGVSPLSTMTRSLYTGMVFSLDWDREGKPPGDDQTKTDIPKDPLQVIRETQKINVAIGNTTIDAFSTLLGQQLTLLARYENVDQIIALLRAFQYDLLPILNSINGDALLEKKVRDAWFNSKSGGTHWAIVAEGTDDDGKADLKNAELTPEEATWLRQLNNDQKALDDAMAQLYSLQWNLHAAWWKQGHLRGLPRPIQAGLQKELNLDAKFKSLFDMTDSKSLLSQVLAQLQKVNGMLATVPQPLPAPGVNDQDAFLKGIEAFAKKKNISAGKVLKAISQPRYWKANNPVVVISGVEPSSASDPDATLTVRLTSQVITGFSVGGKAVNASILNSVIPVLPNTGAMPDAIPALFQEFFMLDPGNADVIAPRIQQTPDAVKSVMKAHKASDYKGVLPDVPLETWSQPWNPMYLEWKVKYIHIPYASNNNPNWIFNGTDYMLDPNANADTEKAQVVGGISLLSPHVQTVFSARLDNFIKTYGDQSGLQQLSKWIETVDDWKFLAQELVNFGDMLIQRDGRAFRRPGIEAIPYNNRSIPLADITGYPGGITNAPYATPPSGQGLINNVPFILNDVNVDFHGVRRGQMYFTDLIVYDKFGRVLNVILSSSSSGLYDAENFPLIHDHALDIDKKMRAIAAIAAPVQLPPRLLQHARLDMLLIDQKDDTKILGLNKGVNPVCGWIIPNHLDQDLLLYAADGTSTGELRLIKPASGAKQVRWFPPHSTMTLDQVDTLAPHVFAFIKAAQGRSETEFQALLTAIDSTLWTIDPLGNRSDQNLTVLVGRPLALVRTRLQFKLDGPPITDVGWASTFKPPPPDFVNDNFSIRLGDQATRDDGVIGYFVEKKYGKLNSVVAPPFEQNYIRQIGPLGAAKGNYIDLSFNEESVAHITLLVDPRAAIHATTGILPVKELTVPAQFIDDPLANMEIAFHVGPLLTRILPTSKDGEQTPEFPNSIDYLPIAEQNGKWSWWEKAVADPNAQPPVVTWQGYDLAKALPNAELKGIPSSLREGLLQLVTNLKDNK